MQAIVDFKKKFVENMQLIDAMAIKNGYEIFRKITGHDTYSVSTKARVRNDKTGKILKPRANVNDGYYQVRLNGKNYSISRLVALAFIPNPENKPQVDHINNDRTNNNISNLRWVTNSENQHNASIPQNNTSGTKGVNWYKRSKKWHAYIKHNNKKIHLGSFDNIEDAILARKLKANELFKEHTNTCEKL